MPVLSKRGSERCVPRVVAKHAVRDVTVHQPNLDALDKTSDRVTMSTPDVARSTGRTQPFGRETCSSELTCVSNIRGGGRSTGCDVGKGGSMGVGWPTARTAPPAKRCTSAPSPRGETVHQVSRSGGWAPRWRHDGKELFFVREGDGMVMANRRRVSRQRGDRDSAEPPALFAGRARPPDHTEEPPRRKRLGRSARG